MRPPFSKSFLRDEEGQITVLLSLVFLVLMSITFCIIEGVREYEISALTEDAAEGAAAEVLANYDKELFLRYHLFFLDPREKSLIEEDGRRFLNDYFTEDSFFGYTCKGIEIDRIFRATDQEGKVVKTEIIEWMKYRKEDKQAVTRRKLLEKEAVKLEAKVPAYVAEIRSTPTEIAKEDPGMGFGSGTDSGKEGKYTEGEAGHEEGTREDWESGGGQELSEEAILWKSIKDTLTVISGLDPVSYALAGKKGFSSLSVSLRDLPSSGRKGLSGGKRQDLVPECRWEEVDELEDLFPKESMTKGDADIYGKEAYIMDYIDLHFKSFGREEIKTNEGETGKGTWSSARTALQYEKEYMAAGKKSDRENLASVANRIFLLRFLANYDYARNNAQIEKEAEKIAEKAAGTEGLPGNMEAGKLILIGALAYGQTYLDIRCLLEGDQVDRRPQGSSFLTFSSFSERIRGKKSRSCKDGISYEDYLTLFLMTRVMKNILCYRMMDLMQLNVQLKEDTFAMKECIFSYRWKITLRSMKWYPSVPGLSIKSGPALDLTYIKVAGY